MGKVKYFPPLGVGEAFRQHCIRSRIKQFAPKDLIGFVGDTYPVGEPGAPGEIYLLRLLDNASVNTIGGEKSTNRKLFTKVGPNTYALI